jgi:fructose-bisphosphate aldolase class I
MDHMAQGASGVILCDETFRQHLADGQPFPDALAERGLLAGIKVDTGAKPLAGMPGETVTEGLDGAHGATSGESAVTTGCASLALAACPSTRTRPANRASMAFSPSRTISWSSTRTTRTGRVP